MLVLILVLGVYPQLLFKIFDPAVTGLVDHLGRYLDHVIASLLAQADRLGRRRRSTGTPSRPS